MSAVVGGDTAIELPDWLNTWPAVVQAVRKLEQRHPEADRRAVLRRLATDGRMRNVWTQLTSRNRQTGDYQYPATVDGQSSGDAVQHYAMIRILDVAFNAQIEGRAAGTIQEVQRQQACLRDEAATLRRIADDIFSSLQAFPPLDRESVVQFAMDAQALRRVATWRDELAKQARGPDDPLTMKNQTNNPLGTGVAATVSTQFLEYFGQRFDGLSSTIASVASDTEINERAVRTAHARKGATQ